MNLEEHHLNATKEIQMNGREVREVFKLLPSLSSDFEGKYLDPEAKAFRKHYPISSERALLI